eukprot:6177603-Ditylum_brightwellii.AAC.1
MYQHVLAIGDFVGGKSCAEKDVDGKEEVRINIREQLGWINGRGVHWVLKWKDRDRFSIVYYSTDPNNHVAPAILQ